MYGEFAESARAQIGNRLTVQTQFSILNFKFNTWRIRLVGRGRTIGNRVTGNTVPEFESLILRQEKPKSNLFGLGFSYAYF